MQPAAGRKRKVEMRSLFAAPRLVGGLTYLTYKRLAGNPGLALLALFQIVLTVGLLSSAGFFAQAVDRVILQEELDALSTRRVSRWTCPQPNGPAAA